MSNPHGEGGASGSLVQSMMRKVREIKTQHPNLSGRIDALEDELRSMMEDTHKNLGVLDDDRDQKLMTIYVINLIHNAIDEILAD